MRKKKKKKRKEEESYRNAMHSLLSFPSIKTNQNKTAMIISDGKKQQNNCMWTYNIITCGHVTYCVFIQFFLAFAQL